MLGKFAGLRLPSDTENTSQWGVYEELAKNRVLFLYGPIIGYGMRQDFFGPQAITDTLLLLEKRDSFSPIWLIIDSVGGSIPDGLMLYDAIKTTRAPVYTVGRNCYSMATLILAAGTLGHRFVYPNSAVMLHLPMGSIGGDAEDMDIQNKEMQKTKLLLVDLLLECGVKKDKKSILKDINRNYWMNADETIMYGLADNKIVKGALSW